MIFSLLNFLEKNNNTWRVSMRHERQCAWSVVAWIFNSMFMPLSNHSCNPQVMESHAISE
jgi:hypothetical protein